MYVVLCKHRLRHRHGNTDRPNPHRHAQRHTYIHTYMHTYIHMLAHTVMYFPTYTCTYTHVLTNMRLSFTNRADTETACSSENRLAGVTV